MQLMEAVEEAIILITSIVAVTLILTYASVSYSNYSRYLIAHEELANIVLEAYGITIGNSTLITLGNLGRVNAYLDGMYALTNNSGETVGLNSIIGYLTYTVLNRSEPIVINGRLLLEPGHALLMIIKGHYSGISVKVCPTQASNTCNWVTLRWIITKYSSNGTGEVQTSNGWESSVSIMITNDSLGIPWSISVNVNGPGGYTYQKSGSGDYAWVQYLTNSLQSINSSISLTNYLLKQGDSAVYEVNSNYYECGVKPTSYSNVKNGSITYIISCLISRQLGNWAVFLSGNGPQVTLSINDPTYIINQGWNSGVALKPMSIKLTITWNQCLNYPRAEYCPISLNGTTGWAMFTVGNSGWNVIFTTNSPTGSPTIVTGTFTYTLSWSGLSHFLYIILVSNYTNSPYIAHLNIVNNTYGAPWNITAQPWGNTLLSGSGNINNAILKLPGNPVNITVTPPIVYLSNYNLTCLFKPIQVEATNGSTITITVDCLKGSYALLKLIANDTAGLSFHWNWVNEYNYNSWGGNASKSGIYTGLLAVTKNTPVDLVVSSSGFTYINGTDDGEYLFGTPTMSELDWYANPGGVYTALVNIESSMIIVDVNAPSGTPWTVNWVYSSVSGSQSGSGSGSFNISDTSYPANITITGYPNYCTASPTNYTNVKPPATVTFTLNCLPSSWSIYVSVNNPDNAGFRISDNYGNSISGTYSVLVDDRLGIYSRSQSPVSITANITSIPSGYKSCIINPSQVQVNEPLSGSAYETFNITCIKPNQWSVTVNVVNDTLGAGWQITSSNNAYSGNSSESFTLTYPDSVTSVSLTASIINNPSGFTCSIKPSSTTVTPSTGSVTFTVDCVGRAWSVYVSVTNDSLNAGWVISDNYGHKVSGSSSGSNLLLSTYSSTINSVSLTASVSNPTGYTCSIKPSSTSISKPSSGVAYVSFTISCVSNTWGVKVSVVNDSLGASWQINTNPTATVNGVPGVSSLSDSGDSSATFTYPGSVTTALLSANITINPSGYNCSIKPNSTTVTSTTGSVTFTVNCISTSTHTQTHTHTTTTTGVCNLGAGAKGGGNAGFGNTLTATWTATVCSGWTWAGWGGPVTTSTSKTYAVTWTASASSTTTTITQVCKGLQCSYVPEIITYTVATPVPVTWIYNPPTWCNNPKMFLGGSLSWNSNATYTLEQPATFTCGSTGFVPVIFPWDWEPPTLPIWLWLRGGTNTIAPLEPIYIQAFNEYAEWFWSNACWVLDILVAMVLILPILAKPIIGRRRLGE